MLLHGFGFLISFFLMKVVMFCCFGCFGSRSQGSLVFIIPYKLYLSVERCPVVGVSLNVQYIVVDRTLKMFYI